MAIVNANGIPPVTINSAAQYNFGNSGTGGEVSTTNFDIRSSSFSGSITVVGRAQGTANPFLEIPYVSRYLNGASSDDSSKTDAITGDSIIEVDSTGLDVGLDCTAYTSGSMVVTPTRVAG